MQRLKVLTLNIWNRENDWDARRGVIRDGLSSLAPDLVGLQEVLELRMEDARFNQAEELAEGLGYTSVYGTGQVLGMGLEIGNALLSRHPIVSHEVLALPGASAELSRSVLFARVATPWAELPVFVTHLNWKMDEGSVRLAQLEAIVDFIAAKAPAGEGPPPLLLGDLNAEPESEEIRWMRGLTSLRGRNVYFADAWSYGGDGGPGFTFDRRNPNAALAHEPPRRIDYIFVRGPDAEFLGEPLHARLVFAEPVGGVWASDHFGLYSEISVAK